MSRHSFSERPPRHSGGFTLLEILVAISIVALVLTAVYGVFTSISGAKQRLEHDGEVYQRARVIFDRLGRELRGICPIGGAEQKGVFRTGTDADGHAILELTTSATAQQGVQQTGIALIRYTLAPEPENGPGQSLFRSEQSALLRDEVSRENGAMRLATGVTRLEWRFLLQDEWHNELDVTRDGLPALVEVTLTMTDSRGQQLPFRSAFDLPDIVWRAR